MHTIQYHNLEHRSLAYTWSHGPHPKPLVVIHGLGDSAVHTYAPLFASTVLQNTPSLFIDLPGFGEASASLPYSSTIEAMADDVASLLSALQVEKASIFAHSMGANIAIALSTSNSGMAPELILAEPLLRPEDSVLAAGIAKQTEESFVARGFEMLVRATSIQVRRGGKVAEAFLPTLNLANPVSMHRAATSLLRDREPSFTKMLAALPNHKALLIGEHTETDLSALESAGIPIHRLAHTGHSMMVESAFATACVILNIANGTHDGANGD